jgi:hypothetical protein
MSVLWQLQLMSERLISVFSFLFDEFLMVMIFFGFSVDFILAMGVVDDEDDLRFFRRFSSLSEDSRCSSGGVLGREPRAFFVGGGWSLSAAFVEGNGRVRFGGVLKGSQWLLTIFSRYENHSRSNGKD